MTRECACHSGKSYAECCAPFHRGASDAPTPEALMRSRYAAFALGLGEYLVHTLATSHADYALPRCQLVSELLRAHLEKRFVGLRILFSRSEGDCGEVLFFARTYHRGADVSFAELSQFVREGGAWRYAEGVTFQSLSLPRDLQKLTREVLRTDGQR